MNEPDGNPKTVEEHVQRIIDQLNNEEILKQKAYRDWIRKNDTFSTDYQTDEREYLSKPQGIFRGFYDLRFATPAQVDDYMQRREEKIVDIYRTLYHKSEVEMMLLNREFAEDKFGRELTHNDIILLFREFFELMKKLVTTMSLLRLCKVKDEADYNAGPSSLGEQGSYVFDDKGEKVCGADGKPLIHSLMQILGRIPNIRLSYKDGEIPLTQDWLRSLERRSN